MGLTDNARTFLWNELFHCDMRLRFYLERAQSYRRIDQLCLVFSAVAGSAAFITTLNAGIGAWATQTLTAIAAISSAYMAFSRPGDKARLAANLASKNGECLRSYERLWAQQDEIDDDAAYQAVDDSCDKLQTLEAEAARLIDMPTKRMKQAYEEAEIARAHG